MEQARTSGQRLVVLALAALLFVLALSWRVLAFSGFTNDHYIHLARAQQVVLGAWPVRDFVDPGMPLMYLVSAAAWWLSGGTIGAEVLLVAVAFAVGATCTFMATRSGTARTSSRTSGRHRTATAGTTGRRRAT